MYKILWIGIFLTIFNLLFFNNLVYIDLAKGCFIKIIPGLEFNNAKIIDGIDILKNASPKDYQDLCGRVDTIDPNVGCGGFEGGCFYESNPRTIYVTTAGTTLEWVAGVLVHETCHAKQFAEKRPLDQGECHKESGRVIKKIVAY